MASERKLSKSPHTIHDCSSSESESENERECEGKGVRMFEVAGLQLTAQGPVCCRKCESGPIVFREKMSRRQGVISTVRIVRRCQKYPS